MVKAILEVLAPCENGVNCGEGKLLVPRVGFKTGSYVGDGSSSHPITGLGFQPKYVYVQIHKTAMQDQVAFYKTDRDTATLSTKHTKDSFYGGIALGIISLDVDGFTVAARGADIDPNKNGVTYDYWAFG